MSSVPSKSIEKEVEDYFCDENTATNSLMNYPHLLQAFLKFNAALPSSAAWSVYSAALGKY
jgi:hypothetical protein